MYCSRPGELRRISWRLGPERISDLQGRTIAAQRECPADANETVEAWSVALQQPGPVTLSLSREALPTRDRAKFASAAGLAHGAYVLADTEGGASDVILIATGGEVSPCIEAQASLKDVGVPARVVSMPCRELFEAQDHDYRELVLPSAGIAVEAAAAFGWDRYAGPTGQINARADQRHVHVWIVRPDQGRHAPLRLHGRARHQGGAGASRRSRAKGAKS
jgi:hypothetical protein